MDKRLSEQAAQFRHGLEFGAAYSQHGRMVAFGTNDDRKVGQRMLATRAKRRKNQGIMRKGGYIPPVENTRILSRTKCV